jgi:hypothetical protein
MSTGPTDDVVRLVTAENPVQAHIWERALQEEGIHAKVVGDYLDASLGDLPGLKPEIWVHRSEIPRAEEVLRECQQALSDEDLEEGMSDEDEG